MLTVKLKATSLFSKERWKKVRDAVRIVNSVVQRSTLLAKLYVLSTDEDVALDAAFYDLCFKVTTASKLSFRGGTTEAKEAKRDVYKALDDLYSRNLGERVGTEGLSLSHALAYAAADLETAVLNNIELHYHKHARLYATTFLDDKQIACKAVSHVLFGGPEPEGLGAWLFDHGGMLAPEREQGQSFDTDVRKRPWVYLRRMVHMSRAVEARDPRAGLLSPVPIRRSLVPKHVHFDTNALVQLLMDASDIKDFVNFYQLEKGERPALRTKGDLGNSFRKVFGRDPESREEDFEYQGEFWRFLCNLDSPKYRRATEGRGMCFGNSIDTDGCSVSMLLVTDRGKKTFSYRKNAPREAPEFVRPPAPGAKFYGVDPGKGDLITVSDGRRTFRYTSGQRDHELRKSRFERRSQLVVKGEFQCSRALLPGYYPTLVDPTLERYETEVLSVSSSRSCNYETFESYVRSKVAIDADASRVYSHPRLRNDAFSKYALERSSQDRMLNRLKKFLKGETEKTPRDCHDENVRLNYEKPASAPAALFYGDWGRRPNLRNSAPTPGVGLRRKIDRIVPTVTVAEHYTSKTCPCCRDRSLQKAKLEGHAKAKHTLLCCESCGRLWNRNVVGSYNILARGLSNMKAAPAPA